jgi:hypothetical protein
MIGTDAIRAAGPGGSVRDPNGYVCLVDKKNERLAGDEFEGWVVLKSQAEVRSEKLEERIDKLEERIANIDSRLWTLATVPYSTR